MENELFLLWQSFSDEFFDEMGSNYKFFDFLNLFIEYTYDDDAQLLLLERRGITGEILSYVYNVFKSEVKKISDIVLLFEFLYSPLGNDLILTISVLTRNKDIFKYAYGLTDVIIDLIFLFPQSMISSDNSNKDIDLNPISSYFGLLDLEIPHFYSFLITDVPTIHCSINHKTTLLYNLFTIMNNLTSDNHAVGELILFSNFKRFLEIGELILNSFREYKIVSFQIYVRSLSFILSELCSSNEWINVILNMEFIPSILKLLRRTDINTTILLESSQILINILILSHRFSRILWNEFINNKGNKTLADAFIFLGEIGTLKEQKSFLYHLSLMSNIKKGTKDMLYVFQYIYMDTFNSETRSLVLDIIYVTFNQFVKEKEPIDCIKILCSKFEYLNMEDRKKIHSIVSASITERTILSEELKSYIKLINSSSISVVIDICDHTYSLLKNSKVSQRTLRDLGLLTLIQKNLDNFSTIEISPKEVKYCEYLGYFDNLIDVLNYQLLSLLNTMLESSSNNQSYFVTNGSYVILFQFLKNELLRPLCLQILSVIGVSDDAENTQFFTDAIIQFQNFVSLPILHDILSALCIIIHKKEFYKDIFRECGGIFWMATLLTDCIKDLNAEETTETFPYLSTLLDLFAITATHNTRNQRVEMELIINNTALLTSLFKNFDTDSSKRASLIDTLFSLACEEWPPNCTLHTREFYPSNFLMEYGEYWGILIRTYDLSLDNFTGSKCSSCEESLTIEIPEIFGTIFRIIEDNDDIFLIFIKSLVFLVDHNSDNLDILYNSSFPQMMIKLLREDESTFRKTHILNIFLRIAKYSLKCGNLKDLLQLIYNQELDPFLLNGLLELSHYNSAPSNYIYLSKGAFVELDLEKDIIYLAGFTMTLWINIEESRNFDIFTISSKQSSFLSVKVEERQIVITDSFSSKFLLDTFKFKKNKWYHLVISYTPPRLFQSGKISIYMNGLRAEGKEVNPILFDGPLKINLGPTNFKESFQYQPLKLGNIFLFRGDMDTLDAFKLYTLGPNYLGMIPDSINRFTIFDYADSDHLVKLGSFFLNLEEHSSFETLKTRLMMIFNCKNISYAVPGSLNKNNPFRDYKATYYSPGHVINRKTIQIRDGVHTLGGVQLFLIFFPHIQKIETLITFISIINNFLSFSKFNKAQMQSLNGYDIISNFIEGSTLPKDEKLIDAIFALVGVKKSRDTELYTDGIIKNLDAYEKILLNWNLWSNSSDEIQIIILQSLLGLISSEKCVYAELNIARYKEVQTRSVLIYFLDRDLFSYQMMPYVVHILKKIMKPSREDIRDLLRFIVSNNDNKVQSPCPYNEEHFSIFNVPIAVQGISETKTIDHDGNKKNIILWMIFDLIYYDPSVEMFFFETCPIFFLFGLLQSDSDDTRSIILQIIQIYILSKPEEFKLIRGYDILGNQLKLYPLEDEYCISVLLSMLFNLNTFGREIIPLQSYFHSINVLDLIVLNPDILISLFLLLSSCHIPAETKMKTLRVLLGYFLKDDFTKNQFIETRVFSHLAKILTTEIEHKIHRTDEVEDDDYWKIEDYILNFLKSMIIHGCFIHSDVNLLGHILICLHAIPFPNYRILLQYRILYDNLKFMFENYDSINNNDVIDKVTMFTLKYYVYLKDQLSSLNEYDEIFSKCSYFNSLEKNLIELIFDMVKVAASISRSRSIFNIFNRDLSKNLKITFECFVSFILSTNVEMIESIFALICTLNFKQVFLNEKKIISQILFSIQKEQESERIYELIAFFKSQSNEINKVIAPNAGEMIVLLPSINDKIPEWFDQDKDTISLWNKTNETNYIDIVVKLESVGSLLTQQRENIALAMLQIHHDFYAVSLHHQRVLQNNKKDLSSSWKRIIKDVTHQRGFWPADPDNEFGIIKWDMDHTEGPMRRRIRLRPYYAHKHPIIYTILSDNSEIETNDPRSIYLSAKPFDFEKINEFFNFYTLFDESEKIKMQDTIQEEIVMNLNCHYIRPYIKRKGFMTIGKECVYFIEDTSNNVPGKRFFFELIEIEEIHKRRYTLQNIGIEIFLTNGKTHLFSLNGATERENVFKYFNSLKETLPNFKNYESQVFVDGKLTRMSITEKWRKGMITNFEYLMHLNTLGGRSYNSLDQYPIFPYILSDYFSETLDLEDPNSFRDLKKPMGTLTPQREERARDRFLSSFDTEHPPCHHGTHYSNIASVLYYLERLEPFSRFFIQFQSGKFDVADRLFDSIPQSWLLSSELSSSDVKELTPEFYCFPHFLINENNFDLGTKQNHDVVNHVQLPKWSNDPFQFIELHAEALESEYVSRNLHNWIDLIFGYKQQGEEAVKSLNVYYYLTYEGAVNIEEITDEVERTAAITFINNFGQVPRLLFNKKHVARNSNIKKLNISNSPLSITSAKKKISNKNISIGKLYYAGKELKFLQKYRTPLWKTDNIIKWKNWDNFVRILSKNQEVLETIDLINFDNDEISCLDVGKNGRVIGIGSVSGLVRIASIHYTKMEDESEKFKKNHIKLVKELPGHYNSVTSICVSSEFSIIVSCSKDGTSIIWDSNRLKFIRYLQHRNPVKQVAIQKYNGNIITVTDFSDELKGSILTKWTINGVRQCTTTYFKRLTCIVITTIKPGMGRNILIAGTDTGDIVLFDLSDGFNVLNVIKDCHVNPITSICINSKNTLFTSGDTEGICYSHSIKKIEILDEYDLL